ncbi:MAG: MFS transporter [Rhodospirillales bacterium]|nr:MFS transporter [Rhodospirillales bacterium]
MAAGHLSRDAEGVESGQQARYAALTTIAAVLDQRRPLDEAFDAQVQSIPLPSRDRAFAFNLASTVLRRLGQIDDAVDGRLARPLPERRQLVKHLLRLGAAQLLFLNTPAYAAVHTTVTLARSMRQNGHVPLINSLLRRLATEGAEILSAQDAARLNTPDWLWRDWTHAYGPAAARSIATAHLGEPPLDLTIKPDANVASLLARTDVGRLPTGTLRLPAFGAVAEIAGYDEGLWWVQDVAASLPARLFKDVAGRRVFDLCAAPGGKSAQLAAAGAHVIALDRSPKRLARLEENLRRLGLPAETVVADAATWQPEGLADCVLLDAPCSATGTIRRHPDVARLKSAEDVKKLAALQTRLLKAAANLVAPGGILVYCACSLQVQEGEGVVDSFLDMADGWTRAPIDAAEIGGCDQFLTSQGDMRTLPFYLADVGGMDGFFAARLMRR